MLSFENASKTEVLIRLLYDDSEQKHSKNQKKYTKGTLKVPICGLNMPEQNRSDCRRN